MHMSFRSLAIDSRYRRVRRCVVRRDHLEPFPHFHFLLRCSNVPGVVESLSRAPDGRPLHPAIRAIAPDRLDRAAKNPAFLALYDAAIEALDRARAASGTWWPSRFPELADRQIAYFSAEFALHQSLPIYAGGLGVLAGDHCKEASDLGLPLVGVGFLYPMGYFRQKISPDGRQIEDYQRLNYDDVAV